MITHVFSIGADSCLGMVAELAAIGATWTECPRDWSSWFIVTGTPEQIDFITARVGLVAR